MIQQPARWLLISYKGRELRAQSVGVALYVPVADEIYLKVREDLSFLSATDHEILAGTSQTLRDIAVDSGPEAAFQWLSELSSNPVSAQGPYEIETADPNDTLSQLINENCEVTA